MVVVGVPVGGIALLNVNQHRLKNAGWDLERKKQIVTHYLKHKSVWETYIRRLRTLFHSSTSLLKLHYLKRRIFLRFCVGCIDFMAAKKKKQIKNLLPSSSTSIKAGHALKCPLQPWQGRKKLFGPVPHRPHPHPLLDFTFGPPKKKETGRPVPRECFPFPLLFAFKKGPWDLYAYRV